jgi:hypothetical protein
MTDQSKTVAIILGAWLFANFILVPLVGFILTKKRKARKSARVPKGWQVYHSQSKAV